MWKCFQRFGNIRRLVARNGAGLFQQSLRGTVIGIGCVADYPKRFKDNRQFNADNSTYMIRYTLATLLLESDVDIGHASSITM